ncbi:hypothetical protein ACI0FM_11810 [Paenochrobactrum sp. BZR 588]|uniref:hypothetical protein n=1 Tax=Paenochrobactrum TaxID=999488 RepID=UPI0035BC20F8
MASGLQTAITAADTFTHMRIINGMGISLCLSRILIFLSRFIQHPTKHKISKIHMGWVLVILLWIIQFWWDYLFDSSTKVYDVYTYVVDLSYVFGLFFICVTLTPDDVNEYGGYEEYFFSRKKWLFTFFIILNIIQYLNDIRNNIVSDNMEDLIKELTLLAFSTLCILFAMRVKTKKFQFFLIFLLMLGIVADFTLQFLELDS